MPLVANSTHVSTDSLPSLLVAVHLFFGDIHGVFASVSFLLAFAEHLGIQNAGEEDVDQLSQIIRATDCDVNFYLSPSNGFACGKNQIDTAFRNKSMEQNSWNLISTAVSPHHSFRTDRNLATAVFISILTRAAVSRH
jgi:hypothetical protein